MRGDLMKKYKLGFDVWGLIVFLAVMVPNFIWFALPAPNDVLRAQSVTPAVDMAGSVCQVMLIAVLCVLINTGREKLRFSPLIIAAVCCLAVYYAGWVFYYCGCAGALIIFMLTLPPCLVFILFALDRKNFIALIPTFGFTAAHLIFAVVNFIM